jgi:hypothetical protein
MNAVMRGIVVDVKLILSSPLTFGKRKVFYASPISDHLHEICFHMISIQ